MTHSQHRLVCNQCVIRSMMITSDSTALGIFISRTLQLSMCSASLMTFKDEKPGSCFPASISLSVSIVDFSEFDFVFNLLLGGERRLPCVQGDVLIWHRQLCFHSLRRIYMCAQIISKHSDHIENHCHFLLISFALPGRALTQIINIVH